MLLVKKKKKKRELFFFASVCGSGALYLHYLTLDMYHFDTFYVVSSNAVMK
jgi:glutaredoxin-related protein